MDSIGASPVATEAGGLQATGNRPQRVMPTPGQGRSLRLRRLVEPITGVSVFGIPPPTIVLGREYGEEGGLPRR